MTTRPTTSVRVDLEAVKALRVMAAQEGTTVKTLIERALLAHYQGLARRRRSHYRAQAPASAAS